MVASLLGFIGGLADAINGDGSQSGITRFNNQFVDPEVMAQRQALVQQSALQQFAQKQAQQNPNSPIAPLADLASVAPQAAGQAYVSALGDQQKLQMQNPLGAALANYGNQPVNSPNQKPPLSSLQGDDLLQALPPQIASQIKGYSEGRIPFNPRLAATPQGQTLLGLVTQYDPTFDVSDPTVRSKTRTSFTSGTDANNIAALNTAMAHAASLKDAYDKLDNGSYPLLNKIENKLSVATGDKDVQGATSDVAAKGHALSGELAKVFRSTGMAEADIKAWEDKLDVNATPAQQKATLNAAMDLMDGRLQALSEKYNQGLGTSKQGIELLSPKARDAYIKVRGEQPAAAGAVNVGGASTGPTSGAAHLTRDAWLARRPK